jgi:dUTP pyrophosphatase
MPDNMEAQIRSRSGSAFKHSVFVFNGTIDSDFRDNINVLMMNNGEENYNIKAGDRIAQLVFSPIFKLHLPSDGTRSGGFGSTGIK